MLVCQNEKKLEAQNDFKCLVLVRYAIGNTV